jgi:hypothetical protein
MKMKIMMMSMRMKKIKMALVGTWEEEVRARGFSIISKMQPVKMAMMMKSY